jgi:hypothetical protein
MGSCVVAAVDAAALKAIAFNREGSRKAEREAIAALRTAGVELTQLTLEQKQEFRRVTQGPVIEWLKTQIETQDRVTELIEQQTAIPEVLRAIASSPHDLQPIFDAILDSATRLCRADSGSLRLSEESGLRLVAVRGDPLLVSQVWAHAPVAAARDAAASQAAQESSLNLPNAHED